MVSEWRVVLCVWLVLHPHPALGSLQHATHGDGGDTEACADDEKVSDANSNEEEGG